MGDRRRQALTVIFTILLSQSHAISSTSPLDLFAHPRYQIVLMQNGISNKTATELLAQTPAQGETAYHLMRTTAGQGFICSVPPASTVLVHPSASASASAAEDRKQRAREDKLAGLERGLALLEPLKGSCLYLRQGWFTYAFCHGSEIRQFHEIRQPGLTLPAEDPNFEAYTLGQYSQPVAEVVAGGGSGALQEVLAGGGAYPGLGPDDFGDHRRYLVQRWRGGTICDKTGMERHVEVQFHCNTQSTDRIALIRETAICEYVLVIHTPRLCGEPMFLGSESDLQRSATLITRCQPILNASPSGALSAGSDPAPAPPGRGPAPVPEGTPADELVVPVESDPNLPSPDDVDKSADSDDSEDAANVMSDAIQDLIDKSDIGTDFIVTINTETGEFQLDTDIGTDEAGTASLGGTDLSASGPDVDQPEPPQATQDKPQIHSIEDFTESLRKSIQEALKEIEKISTQRRAALVQNSKRRPVTPEPGPQPPAQADTPFVGSSRHQRLARMYSRSFDGADSEGEEASGESAGHHRKDEL